MFFFDEFRCNLMMAVRKDFSALSEKLISEKIYAGCLVVDEDVSGMFLVFNTIEYLNNKDNSLFGEDPFDEFRKILSPEEFQKSFGQYERMEMSTKWVPDEWGYGNNSLCDSFINKINTTLHNKRESLQQRSDFLDFENRIHEAMMASLFSLKEYIKETSRNDIFLFMSVTDSEKSKSIENESAKKLNSEISYNQFIKRIN